MLGSYRGATSRAKDEGEKPFWISFADLMSSLMVLFLLVMSVALLAVTKKVTEVKNDQAARDADVSDFMKDLALEVQEFEGVTIDRERKSINFGERARFDTGSSRLSAEQSDYLRAFSRHVLKIARAETGKKWLKRIVVEGFADRRGTYLLNLNLSLQRSERVICALMDTSSPAETVLDDSDLADIARLFLVGGYSSNSAKESFDESRRIELRLEFFALGETHAASPASSHPAVFGRCRI